MKMSSARNAFAVLAVSGFAAGAALFGTAVASADPLGDIGPLLESTCSFAQVDSALHKVAPDTAAQLDAAPAQKELVRQAFNQPPAQRKAAFQQLIGQQQRSGMQASPNAEFGAKLRQVVDTCHRY